MDSTDLKSTYDLDVIHDRWEKVYRSNPIQDRLNARTHDRVLADLHLPPDGLLLDAGCGVGYHTVAFAQRGARPTGIDISDGILEQARKNAAASGVADRTTFQTERLEALSFADASFDGVHCRGVLMHIPRWEAAVSELCRVLKPGGSIAIMESNVGSVEHFGIQALRSMRPSRSRLVDTVGGLEAWSEEDGQPFVVRVARIPSLVQQMAANGVILRKMWATEFFGIARFPAGVLRNMAIRFNRAYFELELPTKASMGVCLIGQKAPTIGNAR